MSRRAPRAPVSACRSSPRSSRITAAGIDLLDAPDGQGACVHLHFPNREASRRTPRCFRSRPPSHGGQRNGLNEADGERHSHRRRRNADIREIVSGILSDEGHGTRTAKNSDEALNAIQSRAVPASSSSTSGCRARSWTGSRCSEIVKAADTLTLPVVMISGHGNVETAVSGDQAGRLRLHREAVQGRPARAHRRARARRTRVSNARSATCAGALWHGPARWSANPTSVNQLRQVIDRVGAGQFAHHDHRGSPAPARS